MCIRDSPIIAVDIDDSKLDFSKTFGATHTINSLKTDPINEIHEITSGGVEYAFDAIGLKITNEQILAKQTELQTAYDNEQWKRNRQKEYPNHEDCIHALLDGGDTLTDLQAKRTAIKNKYPKE